MEWGRKKVPARFHENKNEKVIMMMCVFGGGGWWWFWDGPLIEMEI
jgi:hypothetical protein